MWRLHTYHKLTKRRCFVALLIFGIIKFVVIVFWEYRHCTFCFIFPTTFNSALQFCDITRYVYYIICDRFLVAWDCVPRTKYNSVGVLERWFAQCRLTALICVNNWNVQSFYLIEKTSLRHYISKITKSSRQDSYWKGKMLIQTLK